MSYDSTADTQAHIDEVRRRIDEVVGNLLQRAVVHDASKFLSPEKEAFDVLTPELKGLTYGSDDYRACLRKMKPVLEHHYANNRHHPEHWLNGIDDMDLMDIVECFCDWKAATMRHADGSLEKSIIHNKERFKMSDQLAKIFENTRRELQW